MPGGRPAPLHPAPPAPVPADDELALRAFLRDFSRRRPRWGWRRAAVAAKTAGWRANHKRIHRLWIAEGLRVPYRKRKKPLRGIGVAVGALCPIRPNVVWAMDFQFDQTSRREDAQAPERHRRVHPRGPGHRRRALHRRRRRGACLERLAAERGAPAYVRFDHGPEFIAYAVADWCRFNGTDTVFIDPGSPWQNAWIESFNGRMRDEHLNGQQLRQPARGPGPHSRTGGSTTTSTGPTAHTAGSPRSSSSRPGSTNNTTTRIAGGSTIGVPSVYEALEIGDRHVPSLAAKG